MARTRQGLLAALTAALLALTSVPAHASETVPATGTFTFTTWPGVLPAWTSANIVLVGISPGSAITTANDVSARVSMPIVARTGSASAAAGGFRFLNTKNGKTVRCQVPTIDTRARAVACVLTDGSELTLFDITSIKTRTKVASRVGTIDLYEGMELTLISKAVAEQLNKALDTTVFTASIKIATAELAVTR